MRTLICPVLLAMAILLFTASCQNNPNTVIDNAGTELINTAIGDGITGIKASALASSRSQNLRVKGLAAMLTDDQIKTNARLKALADSGAVKIDTGIKAAHNQMLNELTKTSGTDFDKAYLQMTIKEQEKDLMLFIQGTQDKNSNLQTFSKETLKTIHIHLDSARAIEQSLK